MLENLENESNIENQSFTTTSNILNHFNQELNEDDSIFLKLFENTEKNIHNYEYSDIQTKLKNIYFFPSSKIKTTIKPECFSIRFDKTDSLLAGGFSTGDIIIYDTSNGNFIKNMSLSEYPISSMRWKQSGQKSILVVVHSDGKVSQWFAQAGKFLYSFEEKDNFIMCLDYDNYGKNFATGGSDNQVRVYDDETKTLIKTIGSSLDYVSHSNRIFSLCYGRTEFYDQFLVSGGWDNTLKFYDMRVKELIKSVYGPHIVGDSIDLKGHYLLTGSSDIKDQIKIWDIRTYQVLEVVNFEPSLNENNEEKSKKTYVTSINSAQFSKSFDNFKAKGFYTFACGGIKNNQLRIFSDDALLTNKKYENKVPLTKLENLRDCVYSIDYMNNSNTIAYGSGYGCIMSFDMSRRIE